MWGLPGQGEVFILPSHGDDKKQTDSFIIVFMFSTMCPLPGSNHSHPPCLGKYVMQCLAHNR